MEAYSFFMLFPRRTLLLIVIATLIALLAYHFSTPLKRSGEIAGSATPQKFSDRPLSPATHRAPPAIQSPDPPRPESIKSSASAADAAARAAARIAGSN